MSILILPVSSAGFTQSAQAPLEHPRLFFDANGINTLRQEANSTHKDIWAPILKYADNHLGDFLPTQAPAHGDLDTYREYGNALIAQSFACVITDKAAYCNAAKRALLTFAKWQQWGEYQWRDLGHAHMLMGNALAYDWLYHRLTPSERVEVRTSLGNWAEKLYEASASPVTVDAWQNWWRKAYVQNHYAIVNSALGMAGLALLQEDDRATKWLDQAADQMSHFQFLLNGIEDGSWHESIAYQSYALSMSLPFLVNLRNIRHQDLIPATYLKNYAYWGIYNDIPGTTRSLMSYGDFDLSWGNAFQPQNIYRFVAAEYKDGHAEWMARQLVDADGRHANIGSAPWYVFEFLYYDPSVAPEPPTDLPPTRVFPDLEGVIWRTGWGQNDLLFGLKTGAYGGRFAFQTFTQGTYPWEPPCTTTGCMFNIDHDHDDSNGFYIFKAGKWLSPETSGVDKVATAYHNTLLIDGQGQYRPKPFWEDPEDFRASDGFLIATADTPSFDYVAADATGRYKQIQGIHEFVRYVLFLRPNYFLMVDSVAADAPHQYKWIAHFGGKVSIKDDWIYGAAGGKQVLGIQISEPTPFVTQTGNDGQPYVRIRPASAVNDVRFVNLLYPTQEADWDMRPTVQLSEDTGEAIQLQVMNNDKSGPPHVDTILLTYSQPYTTTLESHTLGSYSTDARSAVISRLADGTLNRLVVQGGAFLTDNSKDVTLVDNLARTSTIEINYSKQQMTIDGNLEGREIRLYAPHVTDLLINGTKTSFHRTGDYIVVRS